MAETSLNSAFQKFLKFCKAVTDNDQEVVTLIEKRYTKTNESFISSNGFKDLLLTTTNRIKDDVENKFVYIKEFVTELKAYGRKSTKRRHDETAPNEDVSRVKRQALEGSLAHRAETPVTTDHSDTENLAKKVIKKNDYSSNPTSTNTSDNEFVILKNRVLKSSSPDAKEDKKSADPKTTTPPASPQNNPEYPTHSGFALGLGLSPTVTIKPINPDDVRKRLMLKSVPKDDSKVHPAFHESLTDKSSKNKKDRPKSPNIDESESEPEGRRGSDGQIQRLEKLLGKISAEIEKLEEKELSLDDLGKQDTTYTLLDRYKKKFVKVWDKLCDVKGRDTSTGRTVERRFKFEGTRYSEINRKIEKFINKHRIFPDFQDIRSIVCFCNRKYKLRINKNMVDALARDAFTDVGNKLQERRRDDFVSNFGSHLTDSFRLTEDPALYDKQLRRKLDENRHKAKSNIDDVINKYATKQMKDGDDDESEEEEEEEEEEEG